MPLKKGACRRHDREVKSAPVRVEGFR